MRHLLRYCSELSGICIAYSRDISRAHPKDVRPRSEQDPTKIPIRLTEIQYNFWKNSPKSRLIFYKTGREDGVEYPIFRLIACWSWALNRLVVNLNEN